MMGTSSCSKAPSSQSSGAQSDANALASTPASPAATGLSRAARYGNAAAQEALAAKEQERLCSQVWTREDFEPSTGIGMFDLSWDPRTGTLLVVSRLAFVFEDTHPRGNRWEEAGGGPFDPAMGAWQPGETERWKADAIAEIEAAWSTDVVFRHADLPSLPPARVVVHVEEVPPDDAHFTVVVKKLPEDREAFRDNVDTDARTVEMYESAADGVTEVDSVSRALADPFAPENKDVALASEKPVRFGERSSALTSDDRSRLEALSRALGRPGRPRFPFHLWGFAAPEEGDVAEQDALAGRRIEVVARELRRESPETRVESDAVGARDGDAGEAGRRVDLYPELVRAVSTTATHEFGHVLGLPDEYDEDGGDHDRPAGDPDLGYPDRAEEIAGRPLVATKDQSVMSVGDEVRPHHYVTILEALEAMTATEGRWRVGR